MNHYLKFNINCAEYKGNYYGFAMNYSPEHGDSKNFYWKIDENTFVQQTPKIKIEVGMFGRGSVKSDIGGIDADSERENQADNITKAFFDNNNPGKITLTATPTAETQILLWTGCDTVSQDNTQCECSLTADHLISLSFGYKETKLKEGVTLVDLKDVPANISSDMVTLNVTANTGDIGMVSKLAALKAGDVIVGSAGKGFLRRVVSIQKVSDYNYIITTTDVSLEEVIAKGTGVFFKQMTYGDLVQDTSTRSARTGSSFEGIDDSVRLVPSDDPNDRVFKIMIGDPNPHTRASADIGATWKTDDGIEISVNGNVEITIDFEKGCSFNDGLEYFMFIPKIIAKETLGVSAVDKVSTPKDFFKKKIGTIRFSTLYFQIGFLPVFVTPEVEIYVGADATISAKVTFSGEATQTFKGGIIYNRNTGTDMVSSFDYSADFNKPSVKYEGEVKGYVLLGPGMTIYGITGPSIPLKGYLKLKGETQKPFDPCLPKLSLKASCGIEAEYEWNTGLLEKILGKWAPDKIEFVLGSTEWEIYKWEEVGEPDATCVKPCNQSGDSGKDTPETNSYNMGKTSGDFSFSYQTYSQKDRIVLLYDGQTIFDSGCVGTGESKWIHFSGKTDVVTVQVIPNCAGGTGTKWDYTIGCP